MEKRLLSLLLAFCMLLSLAPADALAVEPAEFAGGTGTANDPYLVANKDHLNYVRIYPDAHFKQIADIVFEVSDFEENGAYHHDGAGWIPIGSEDIPFCGIFDGNGHSISGLRAVGDEVGLFSVIGSGVILKNITLSDVLISGENYVAGLVTRVKTSTGSVEITNCHVFGTVSGEGKDEDGDETGKYCGGIVSYIEADDGSIKIQNCTSSGTLYGHLYMGGIAGYVKGNTQTTLIQNCTNYATIAGGNNSNYCGGIVGNVENGITVTRCSNYGPVMGNAYSEDNGSSCLAGIAGYADNSNFTACANYAEIKTFFAAGISSRGSNSLFSNCLNIGKLTHSSDGYGIGNVYQNNTFANCYSTTGIQNPTSGIFAATVETLKSGEVAYLMRDYFGQEITVDEYPVLLNEENHVYQVKNCTGEIIYRNINEDLPHNFVDSICSICGEADPEQSNVVASGTCGENLTWTLDAEGTLTISGEGEMASYRDKRAPWDSIKTQIKKVIIEDGVTTIGCRAFLECVSLSNVEIPDSVTSIGNCVFYDCASLISAKIPDSVTTLGSSVFAGCYSLSSVEIGDSVTAIGGCAFWSCSSLSSVVIPDSVTTIGENAFYYCDSLSSVKIGKNVTTIDSGAFGCCNSLSSVVIPDGVTRIWAGTFESCTSLSTVFYRGTVSQKTNIRIGQYNDEFQAATWHYEVTDVIYEEHPAYLCGKCGHYYAPDGTKLSCDHDYVDGICTICDSYEPATLNGNVYEISNAGQLYWFAAKVNDGENTINGKLMENIVVNEGTISAETIGARVWTPIGYYINYENTVAYAGTFDGNNKAVSGLYFNNAETNFVGLFGYVDIGGQIRNVSVVNSFFCGNNSIGGVVGKNHGSLSDCSNTSDIAGNKNIGGVVGYNDGDVTNCYNSGAVSGTSDYVGGVVGCSNATISNCHNTGTVTGDNWVGGVLGWNTPDAMIDICYNTGVVTGDQYVGGVVGRNDCTITNCYNSGTIIGYCCVGGVVGDSHDTVSNCYNTGAISGTEDVGGVVGYNWYIVTNCHNTGAISGTYEVGGVVGSNDDTINNCYFNNDIYSGNAVGYNDEGTITNVTGMISAQFASGEVAYLLGEAFGQAISIDKIPVLGGKPIYQVLNCSNETAYSNTNENLDHDYDDGKCSVCGEKEPGSVEIVASGWSGTTQWTLTSDGVLTIYGKGNMKNYDYAGGQPWLNLGVDITSVIIEDGVNSVGSGAFKGLTKLENVTLPASGLTKIGEAAFYDCISLKAISLPDGLYTVNDYTFKGCSALEDVRLPKTLVKVGQGAFENCTSLDYIFIPGDTEIIGSWSFKGCTGLIEVDMQWADATEIREGAFKNCSSLTEIILPANIQKLGDSAFYGIGATKFAVPETVTEVGPWCFARAYSLSVIRFMGNAPIIGEGAFNKIFLTAYYPSGDATWTPNIMQNYGGSITWKEN